MADVKITDLPIAASADDPDLVELVHGGVSMRATIEQVRATIGPLKRQSWADDGAAAGPTYDLFRDSASPAANDGLGYVGFTGRDTIGIETLYARLQGVIVDPTDTTEDGRIIGRVLIAGTETTIWQTDAAGLDVISGALRVAGSDVVGSNRHIRLRSYTILGLPASNVVAGDIAWCSDLGGGAGAVIYDGAKWTRLRAGGMGIVNTDVDFTIEMLTNSPTIRHTGTLTANRVLTLGTSQVWTGAKIRVTRIGAGAFTLDVGGAKSLATNTWCDVEYDGAAWRLLAYGTL